METTTISCKGCQKQFASKNQLFRHLHRSAKTCLSAEEYRDFLAHTISKRREKIGVLYGYLPGTDYRGMRVISAPCGVEGGQHAAWLVTRAIDGVSRGFDVRSSSDGPLPWSADAAVDSKINRSYGSISRESNAVAQDSNTGAITELLCTSAPPLSVDDGSIYENKQEFEDATKIGEEKLKKETGAWVKSVNEELDRMLAEMAGARSTLATSPNDETRTWSQGRIRVFGRVTIPQKKFNAETDVTHRRIDYCLPADLMYVSKRGDCLSKTAVQPEASSLEEYRDSLPSFTSAKKPNPAADGKLLPDQAPRVRNHISHKTLAYFYKMKKVMKRIATQVEEINDKDAGAVLEKEFHNAKRKKKNRKGPKITSSSRSNVKDEYSSDNKPLLSKRLLKRKRFHNFCPLILAHDFLAYRRVDRIYHRATIRVEEGPGFRSAEAPAVSLKTIKKRPFIILSLTGDVFLSSQVLRIVGLFIAICRGVIDDDIIDCIFDEEWTNLVPAPPAPHIGLVSGEATYMTWEGRMKAVLNARRTDRYGRGWNNEEVVSAVEEWERNVLDDVARSWHSNGMAKDGRLNTEKQWTENVLHPWAKRTSLLLEDYRLWKASRRSVSTATTFKSFLPPLQTINLDVPPLFEKVLHHLRQADSSGLWPFTTPNRQLVMLSTSIEGSQAMALSISHSAAKKNSAPRSSAYSFKEGEGGASGSFSVGAMPGKQCSQPKSNSLFPELVKAAFDLEIALCPDRVPSSTIAINRNAQFRPHTDNGAGAGQSKSLIVGLGNYVGGELVVEGDKKDIRYKAIQFDGWKEKHWTLPFQGERFSLVWFTPKGCEGVRGIDLKMPSQGASMM